MIVALLLGVGCEKEKDNINWYEGTVLQLKGRCMAIVKITSAPKNGLTVGHTITFNPDFFDGELKIGSSFEFKVIEYEKWEGPAIAECLWPFYVGYIEPYK